MKKIAASVMVLVLILSLFSGCSQPSEQASASGSEKVTITIAGPWEESPAVEAVSSAFTKSYPNCSVVYEYVQNYYEAMKTRLSSDDSGVDLFITKNLQADSDLLPYALELFSQSDKLDLSGTFEGLIENFTYMNADNKSASKQIFAIPLGAEIRGLYVNKTLLSTLGIDVPNNRTELHDACSKLKEAGYIPFQGNPGNFSQWLMYPYICNMIANSPDYTSVYERINSREPGISEFFREPMQFMYDLVKNGYYDYKTAETKYGCFTEGSSEVSARGFLNITGEEGNYQKADDTGFVAFMPGTMSMDNSISKIKSDYHSSIDYTFILAPTGDDGGYAYMSPADGIAVNKASKNPDWALKYMNFLFTPENNKLFAENHHITANTADAYQQLKETFDVSEDHISQLGSVTFDYAFYTIITDTLRDISKSNNPKYMQDNGDGTFSMYPFEHFMENLESGFQKE
jgi:ABC-type glycerol-3-phosphate transport system substrate-binding protein